MTITLRTGASGKGSALTHSELDGNFTNLDTRIGGLHGDFTTLGVTNLTDGTENLDVSKMIINSDNSPEGSDPRLQVVGTAFESVRFKRTGLAGVGGFAAFLVTSEYTDAGHTAGQGTGMWTKLETTDGDVNAGAFITAFENVTDSTNWTTSVELRPVKTVNGSQDYGQTVLSASHNKVEVKNTQDFVLAQSIPLWLTPTPYDDLPPNTGSADDGKIAYLTFNGAATNNARFKLIYSKGGSWWYVSDDGLVDDGSNGGN